MHFSKAERTLNEVTNYNPPPGYYTSDMVKSKPHYVQDQSNTNFAKQERFKEIQLKNTVPGPGHYYNNKDTKKRILEEYRKKQQKAYQTKMNSIPSIPKQSGTKIYEQLAPGILVMHQAQQQSKSIGPGSYDPKIVTKKIAAAKMYPQHKKKFIDLIPEDNAQELMHDNFPQNNRKEYSKNIIKKSPLKQINQSDLCLELIILREKQLRPDFIPPPGYYHNEKQFSSFKIDQKPTEIQFLSGKTQRFSPIQQNEIGPGKYELDQASHKKLGGFIPKASRKFISQETQIPGPGTYKILEKQKQIEKIKGKYPPIFGSGCVRFTSNEKRIQEPGPGAYHIDKNNNKKKRPRTINIKNMDNTNKKDASQEQLKDLMITPETDITHSVINRTKSSQKDRNGNSSFFSSNIKRFQEMKESQMGPGKYNVGNSSGKKSFNKRDTVLEKQSRFKQKPERTKLGPGCYQVKDEIIHRKKYYDIQLK